MSGDTDTEAGADWRADLQSDDGAESGESNNYVVLSSMAQPDELTVQFQDDGEEVSKEYDNDDGSVDEVTEVRFEVEPVEIEGRVLDSNKDYVMVGETYTLDVGQKSLKTDLAIFDDLEDVTLMITVDHSGEYPNYSAEVVDE